MEYHKLPGIQKQGRNIWPTPGENYSVNRSKLRNGNDDEISRQGS